MSVMGILQRSPACSPQQISIYTLDYRSVTISPHLKNRLTPAVDCPWALLLWRGHHVNRRNSPTLLGELKTRPFFPTRPPAVGLRESHMGSLHFASSESLFQVQVQSISAKATLIGVDFSVACCAAHASTTCWWINPASRKPRVQAISSSKALCSFSPGIARFHRSTLVNCRNRRLH